MAGGIARGDVRLYRFASLDKKRLVVVLTRDSAVAYLSTVCVALITSTIRGVPSEVVLGEDDGMKERFFENNLDCFHMWDPLHSILHIRRGGH